uniref:Uncharacterized protein n=1 Tax=viral metagenome TaxID=1070528 RepID=A0A6M3JTW3_9ZZZZ
MAEVDFDVEVEAEAVCEIVAVEVEVAVPVEVEVAVAVAVAVLVAIPTPICPSSTCQRYVVAVSDTEISDNRSPASANVALVSRAVFRPPAAPTTIAPPPSVSIRSTKRIPARVGATRVRVSADAPETISHI